MNSGDTESLKHRYSEKHRVFEWKAFTEWKPVLEGMFRDILTPDLKVKIKKNRYIVQYRDDPEAFETLASQSIKAMITMEKISEFRRRYSHIRVYHACRPEDVSIYYEKGILPSIKVKDVQVERFRGIFLNGKFPELTEEILQQSIKIIGSKEDELSLHIDDRFMLEHSTLYLIYGSEYLSNLVNNLPIKNSKEKYCSVLRRIGKPTFFEINLPTTTEYSKDNNLWELIRDMIMEWTYCLAHSRALSSPGDNTFELSEPLPPEHICSHYHPRKIIDRFMGGKIYDTETGEYEENIYE